MCQQPTTNHDEHPGQGSASTSFNKVILQYMGRDVHSKTSVCMRSKVQRAEESPGPSSLADLFFLTLTSHQRVLSYSHIKSASPIRVFETIFSQATAPVDTDIPDIDIVWQTTRADFSLWLEKSDFAR